jgi:hypothetical protein
MNARWLYPLPGPSCSEYSSRAFSSIISIVMVELLFQKTSSRPRIHFSIYFLSSQEDGASVQPEASRTPYLVD